MPYPSLEEGDGTRSRQPGGENAKAHAQQSMRVARVRAMVEPMQGCAMPVASPTITLGRKPHEMPAAASLDQPPPSPRPA